MAKIVCFGELLMRLSAPAPELLLQSPALAVHVGGAEANVAVSLARYGHHAVVASVAPDNALGHAAAAELRRWGVDVSGVGFASEGRMGLYFLTHGAGMRPAEILYDRAHSSFALAGPSALDVKPALASADWLHVSGITPALGRTCADAALAAVDAARAGGVKVSLDCNYRAKLWAAWKGDGATIMRELMGRADILFADHRDIALALGGAFDTHRAAADAAFAALPNLQRMACTQRTERSASDHDLTGYIFSRTGAVEAGPMCVAPIVDRIGAGDAFAAGVLHGLATNQDDSWTVRFALAACVLKHAIPGDFNLASTNDVLAAMSGESLSVRR